jgi:DNA-binding NarL/FixJ family response regulator
MTTGAAPLRVVIVDDHPIVRDGLKSLLSSIDDVVIMDIEMPGMGGIEATRVLAARHPSVPVLALTMYGQDDVFVGTRSEALP